MRPSTARRTTRAALFGLALGLLAAPGCTTLDLPALKLPMVAEPESPYQGVDVDLQLQPSVSEQAYYSVRQARSENAVVLQVEGDSTPVRVLPLPPDDRTVYVSNLLEQTGVLEKLSAVQPTLFRHSSDSINGIMMTVKMQKDARTVRPESDYALQPGDRLYVRKAMPPAMQSFIDLLLAK